MQITVNNGYTSHILDQMLSQKLTIGISLKPSGIKRITYNGKVSTNIKKLLNTLK